ncbi:MAG: peptidoglycan recognition protein family protein [Gemmatimonadaceae bacterium]|nr:peptidoglycan recognition protein family protein [Gemmatimonadaceae bacterium]
MTLPLEAVIADGVALYDATERVRREYPRKRSAKGVRPKGQRIDAVFVHHSGSLGRAGLDGALGAVRFVMTQKPPDERFPGPPYHLWLPHLPVRDDEGRLVIYRLCEDSYRAWHTGDVANDRGVGVCLQGKLTKTGPSEAQVEALEALLPWLSERHGLPWGNVASWLGWHAIGSHWGGRDKPTCPGKPTEAWLTEYIARTR